MARRRTLIVVALLVIVGGPTFTAPSAANAPASAAETPTATELGLVAEVGFGRDAGSGTWNLVQVTASPSVPLAGRIEARSVGAVGASADEQRFEVAAGATRVVHLLLPPAEELTVAFVDDGGVRTPLRTGSADGEVVALMGALGAAPELPSPLNTLGTDRPIRGVAVDPTVLDLGPRALDGLDALLLSSAELRQLSDRHRADLEVAVGNGLELLVHVRPGDESLAFAWDPLAGVVTTGDGAGTTAGVQPVADAWPIVPQRLGLTGSAPVAASMRAGDGRVTATVAAPGDGGIGDTRELWSALVQVRPQQGRPLEVLDQGGDLTSMLFGGGPALPSPWPFALFALSFVVVVGPLNGLVLRRVGRRELAWVTVPIITAVFTAGALGAATARAPVDVPVVRATWWIDGVGQELTIASVQSPGRGTSEVSLPGARDGITGGRWNQVPSISERTPEQTTLRIPLENLQLASVLAWGSPDSEPPLRVTATMEDGALDVEIANTTDVPIDDVEVLFATSSHKVGDLAPGASVTATMDELGPELDEPGHPDLIFPMDMPMGGDMQVGGPGAVGPADPGPGAARQLLAWDQLSGSPGTVWVVGATSSDLGLATPSGAGQVDDRGTFLAVGVTPDHLGGDVLPHEVSRHILRTTSWAPWRPGPLDIESDGDTVLRFRLPGPSHLGELLSTLDVGMSFDERGMGGADPWAEGCFEVTEIDAEGVASEPTEVCGRDVGCPVDAIECTGSDTSITACFEDGRCQTSERIGGLEGGDADLPVGGSGLEVFDHDAAAWVPLEQAFPEGRSPDGNLVSPRGEVLVRARGGGSLDLGQRGLGVEVAPSKTEGDEGASA